MKLVSFFVLTNVFCNELPVAITTWGGSDFQEATKKALEVLTDHNRTFALVQGLTQCEIFRCGETAGYGGAPDENGETTLDAMIIDSTNISIGAVANLHRIKSAASVAWDIMKYTKHTLLVGEKATKFAVKMGYKEEDLSTMRTSKWIDIWKNEKCQPNFWKNVEPSSECGPYNKSESFPNNASGYDATETNHDTVGMVIGTNHTGFSAGTTSNGVRFKIPGRVGDGPIPGAGAYATKFGGAAATGDGDIMMRFLPSFAVVQQLELGTKPTRATTKVIKKILTDYPKVELWRWMQKDDSEQHVRTFKSLSSHLDIQMVLLSCTESDA